MSLKTIQGNLFASATANIASVDSTQARIGVDYRGPAVSNQLNGIFNSIFLSIDALQRSGASYHPLKMYRLGDAVSAVVRYNGSLYFVRMFSNINDNQNPPFRSIEAPETPIFREDYSKAVAYFEIENVLKGELEDSVGLLENYIHPSWNLCGEKGTASIITEWPVGAVYINALDASDPATLFNGGVWEAVADKNTIVTCDGANEVWTTDLETAETRRVAVPAQAGQQTIPCCQEISSNLSSQNYLRYNTRISYTGTIGDAFVFTERFYDSPFCNVNIFSDSGTVPANHIEINSSYQRRTHVVNSQYILPTGENCAIWIRRA